MLSLIFEDRESIALGGDWKSGYRLARGAGLTGYALGFTSTAERSQESAELTTS
jgi:hypothetical protein